MKKFAYILIYKFRITALQCVVRHSDKLRNCSLMKKSMMRGFSDESLINFIRDKNFKEIKILLETNLFQTL